MNTLAHHGKKGQKSNIRALEILVGSACQECLLPLSHEQDTEVLALFFSFLVKKLDKNQ